MGRPIIEAWPFRSRTVDCHFNYKHIHVGHRNWSNVNFNQNTVIKTYIYICISICTPYVWTFIYHHLHIIQEPVTAAIHLLLLPCLPYKDGRVTLCIL